MSTVKKKVVKGGFREGAGRKPKVEEDRIKKLGMAAVKKVYGSEHAFWKKLATESKESFPHKKLLMEYLYGKPKETVELDLPNAAAIPIATWAD